MARERYDLIVRQAKLHYARAPLDLAIHGGRIAKVARKINANADREIDAMQRLTTESFVIAHLHLDKVMTGAWVDGRALQEYRKPTMDARKAIALAARVKERYKVTEIVEQARQVLLQALSSGVTHVRAFADVDTRAELKGVTALLRLRHEFRRIIGLQVVAFPQEGIVADPGAEEYVRKAMELGADVVGGIPWLEATEEAAQKHVDIVFNIAKRFDRDIVMLVDDTGDPKMRTLEKVALKALDENYQGRVQACHARALATYDHTYLRHVLGLLAKAEIGMVTNPHTGPIHLPVRQLIDAGVVVALGQDDVNDAYYPYGRCNMLEVAFLASHLMQMMTPDEMNLLYDMITVNPAHILRLPGHRVAEGGNANLVVLNCSSVHDALRLQPEVSYVVSRGRLVAGSTVERRVSDGRTVRL